MLNWIDSGLIVLYLLFLSVVALLGLKRKETDQENHILAGRKLTLPAFVATLVSTWYGGILGIGEFSFLYGISSWIVFGVPYYIAAGLFAVFLARRARQSPEMTIPDRLFKYYGSPATVAGSIVLLIVTLPMAYVLMIGVLVNQFFGTPVWVGIVFGTFFSVFYVMTGGFRGVLWTDTVQFLLMFIGFAVLLGFSIGSLGGFDFLKANVPASMFSATGGNRIDYIAFWYIVALVTLVEPVFYQRCFAARSVSVARRGIFVSIFFWLIFDFMTAACGLYARAALPDLADPVASYPALAAQILPAGLTGLFFLSLLATIMSTIDSYMFIAATTFSHDLVWRFRRFTDDKIKKWTAVGLGFSSVGTIVIAMVSESVVDIWHDFGSVSTAALLFPLLTSYWGKYQYSPLGAFAAIVLSGAATTFALLYPGVSGSGTYLLNIEPIFVGLAVSIVIFVASRARKPHHLL